MTPSISLEEYLRRCEELGYNPKLPPYFERIVDRNLYSPSIIAAITNISKETARRWFRQNKLTTESASNTYVVSGKKLKEFLFTRPNVINPLKREYPEIFDDDLFCRRKENRM
ncbi:hypothetical protein DER53_03530 [Parageobacillus toebii NBRC 107807]|uniref:Uncharacterized protein n=1 Tax=Parageobacillus toebii NBRC 107807 TaxID=1223503 RepID=A0A6G9J265_9BACL|nr:hypothetical protein [Parageobacillus toebii]MBB3868682.1 hypothetical protein [Parageobacillus toebii NBRC 107807]QIQ32040.1 hypothetical protein DER53_03530 [Parageobacillus toebii NBRC 107807]